MKVQMGTDLDYIYCSKLPMKHRHQYFDDEPKAPKQKREKRKEQKSAWRQQREAKRQELENE